MDTKLETGPGVWELNAHKQARRATHKTTSTTKAIPSPTHMLLVKMQQVRIFKHNISVPCLLCTCVYLLCYHFVGRDLERCN